MMLEAIGSFTSRTTFIHMTIMSVSPILIILCIMLKIIECFIITLFAWLHVMVGCAL